MYHKLIYFFASALFLFSCGNNAPKGKIELNNGEKWEVNAEMKPPIIASEKLISEFAANDGKDYKALAQELKDNNELLISSCTMKGKSHDELHKWLHPYIVLVDNLEKAGNEKDANEVFLKIEQSFKTFNQYFQ